MIPGAGSAEEQGPLFIVGVSRSGTTLLMAMISASSRFAMTTEWRFLPALLRPRPRRRPPTAVETLDALSGHLGRHAVSLDQEAIGARLASAEHATPADAIRYVMEDLAAAEGKPRWANKTPNNLIELPLLASAFPDARFVHIIRDGREVADANRDAPWPPRSLRFWAGWWTTAVIRARADGARLGDRYLEVRYEQLVAAPGPTLDRVLTFLGEPPSDDPLAYLSLTTQLRNSLPRTQRNLLNPPTPGLRPWRETWSHRETVDVEAIAGPLLDELGYTRSVPRAGALRRRSQLGWFYLHAASKRFMPWVDRSRRWMRNRRERGATS